MVHCVKLTWLLAKETFSCQVGSTATREVSKLRPNAYLIATIIINITIVAISIFIMNILIILIMKRAGYHQLLLHKLSQVSRTSQVEGLENNGETCFRDILGNVVYK